jgi:serine/threonine-protein kinase
MSTQREFADEETIAGTRYRVVGLIGSGGMGSVYEVEHLELGKRFVLKALLRSLASRDDLAVRLRNEWRALGRLEHPNIVSVTDAGVTATGVPYYVMERLHGETLAARLRRERRLPLADALGIAADVLDGLSAAHRIGIVHRDVKPANIFLVAGRPVKLLDFGIAKVLDPQASQITGQGIAIGTPRYMAPEQATGETVDARTDLYAAGLILFEMVAGVGPFDTARDANELFLAHLARSAPPLSSAAPGVPPELDRWVARLLAKRPAERPTDAESVATALRSLRAAVDRPAGAQGDGERTLSGGPFDELEGALTVPVQSAGEGATGRAPASDAVTRTGMGPPQDGTLTAGPPPLSTPSAPDTEPDDPPTAGAAPSGATLLLEVSGLVRAPADEVVTHTAAPSGHQGTIPPVTGAAPSASRRPPDRTRLLAGLGLASAAAVAALAVTVTLSGGRQSKPVAGASPTIASIAAAPPRGVAPEPHAAAGDAVGAPPVAARSAASEPPVAARSAASEPPVAAPRAAPEPSAAPRAPLASSVSAPRRAVSARQSTAVARAGSVPARPAPARPRIGAPELPSSGL